jgi:putative ABC transport system permease protein
MSILMILRVALKALSRNKLRTALTMLGMIIGVAAVIAVVALGTGASAAIEDQVKSAGTNLITITPGNMTVAGAGGARGGSGTSVRLTPDDAKALRDLPEVEYIAEQATSRQQVIAGNQNWSTTIQGTNVDMQTIRSWPTLYGSFFSEQDVQSAAKVCVLGAAVADNLYGPDYDPTDETVRIRNHVFRVLGVMARKGASASGQDQDDTVFAPYTTVLKKLTGQTYLGNIIIGARSADQVQPTADAITGTLHVTHKIQPGDQDDFTVRTLADMIALRTQTTQTMTSLLASIAAVSLLVGGIGIMNIMLVSVTERTREIGLRMAIGARGYDVLMQFLVEAVVISLLGGGIGILLGYGISEFIKDVLASPAQVPPNAVLVAVGFAAGVGVFFGFYPARKAAGLDPIEALRFE